MAFISRASLARMKRNNLYKSNSTPAIQFATNDGRLAQSGFHRLRRSSNMSFVMPLRIIAIIFFSAVTLHLSASSIAVRAQSKPKSLFEMSEEVSRFVDSSLRDMKSRGLETSAKFIEVQTFKKRQLAKKYAAEASARPDLVKTDFYYLGLLFEAAWNDEKALESMKRFLADYPAAAEGSMIQSARGYAMKLSVRQRRLADAELYLRAWKSGTPIYSAEAPSLGHILARGFLDARQYDKAVDYARTAMTEVIKLKARDEKERRDKDYVVYGLAEVLARSYKEQGNDEKAIQVLAEACSMAFAMPSGTLYSMIVELNRKLLFSYEKLVNSMESNPNKIPAPELEAIEWIGSGPIKLSELRGKVVLINFWGPWIDPNISGFSRLRELYRNYAGEGLVIIAPTHYYGQKKMTRLTAPEELDYLTKFRTDNDLRYPVVVVPLSDELVKYGADRVPTTFLLDRNGAIRFIDRSIDPDEGKNLERIIKILLKTDATGR